MKPILFTFAFAATLAAQNFIQMSDPQFGMFTKDASFEHETVNFEFAIATANRLEPAFVVITGDLINKGGDAAQAAEFQRISAKLDPKIRLFSIPGNHDVGNEPTAESLALYRERFGKDYYSFRIGDIAGFVLNSNLEKGVSQPHWLSCPPPEVSLPHSSSISFCVSQSTASEIASLNLKCGLPLSAMNCWPSSWKSIVITDAFGPGPASP